MSLAAHAMFVADNDNDGIQVAEMPFDDAHFLRIGAGAAGEWQLTDTFFVRINETQIARGQALIGGAPYPMPDAWKQFERGVIGANSARRPLPRHLNLVQ